MPIRKNQKDKDVIEFDAMRVYTDAELLDFHNKIQRFYEPKTIHDPSSKDCGKTYQIFNYDKFGVAYGALVEREGAFGQIHYLAVDGSHPTRYEQMWNLLDQYWSWVKKQDWIENKKLESYAKLEEEVPF